MTRRKKKAGRKKTGSKRSRKTTTRRKKTTSRARRKPARRSRLRRFILLGAGLIVGLMIPWMLYLNYLVTSEFEGRKWDLPSRVYARPLTLYQGLALPASGLEAELAAAGYRRLDEASQPGTWSRRGGRFVIHRRGFRFDDGAQEPIRFRVDIAGGVVNRLASPVTGTGLDLVRLDPAEFASIYPLHDEDRTLVSLDRVPELLVTGLQAVEDRKFKHHHGVDPRGIARAMVANFKAGQAVQGGSTLTQQLVKNFYLSNERSLARKINEALMALLLEWHYDKSDILEAYINEVFLGQQGAHAIHGFGRASEFYFGRPLEDLEADQVALLVGLVKGASLYNPRRNPERAMQRRNQVLDIFEETGLLESDRLGYWKKRPLGVTPNPGTGGNRYGAFVDLVRDQLRRDYREADLRNEGLRIFTTLAPFEQEAAERSLSGSLDDLGRRGLPDALQGALVLAEPDSGEVRALVGDRHVGRQGFNRALNARRQVGSVIKPLVYLLALEHGESYNWMTRIEDEVVTLAQPDGSHWTPSNYDGKSHGSVSLLEAMIRSYNQATVRLGMTLGVNQLVRKLEQLGIDQDIEAVPSALLGAVELTPLEVAQVYQSIAAGGYSVPLRSVTAVHTPAGQTLKRYPLHLLPLERRDAVAVLNYGLTEVTRNGTARGLPELLGKSIRVAGKTGTTNERRDSWFVGYTRNRIGVAWVGLDDNAPAGVTGSNAAMRVWASLFRELPVASVSLDMPEGAYWMWVNTAEAALSDEACANAVQMPFVEGSEPSRQTDCLARMNKQERKPFWRKWFDKS
jgi:penicillin-binding protein 1B